MSSGYEIENVNLGVAGQPLGVSAGILPGQYPMFDGKGNTIADYKLQVYVNSDAAPGKYVLRILGTGAAKNLATSEYMQMANETLGTLYLTVAPSDSKISVGVGEPTFQTKELCVDNDPMYGGERMCNSFVGKEEFPITVSSSQGGNAVRLSASNIPKWTWAKFVPSSFIPNGNEKQSGKLVLAGAVRPFVGFSQDTAPLIIQASSNIGNATGFTPVFKFMNVTVLHSAAEIDFPDGISANINGTNYGYTGLVYDTDDRSSLPVSMSIAGITAENGAGVSAIPSWMKAELPSPSFMLDPNEPYYPLVTVATQNAPVGTYYLAINEVVGGEHFTGYAKFVVPEPIYFPPAAEHPVLSNIDSYIQNPLQLNSTSLPTAIEFSIHNGNNFALHDVGIGQFYTAVTGLALENASRIDMLASNGTGTIRGTLVASGPQLGANETGQSHIFWTMTAANDTDATMESVLFQRQMEIAAIPEFSLASAALASSFIIGVAIVITRYFGIRASGRYQ